MDLSFGNSPTMFGHADYYEAMRRGMSSEAILNWLNRNQHTLSQGNKPGGQDGLYDQISNFARNERETRRLKGDFENRMRDIQMKMTDQRAGYEKQLLDMRNTLTAAYNPQETVTQVGVKGSGDKSPKKQQMRRQGVGGAFSRSGLRIKNLNI